MSDITLTLELMAVFAVIAYIFFLVIEGMESPEEDACSQLNSYSKRSLLHQQISCR